MRLILILSLVATCGGFVTNVSAQSIAPDNRVEPNVPLVPLKQKPEIPMISDDLIKVREKGRIHDDWLLFRNLGPDEASPTQWFVADPQTGRWWKAVVPEDFDGYWRDVELKIEEPNL